MEWVLGISLCCNSPYNSRAENHDRRQCKNTYPLESCPSVQGHRNGGQDICGPGSWAWEACKVSYLKNNANSWLVFTLIKNIINDYPSKYSYAMLLMRLAYTWLTAKFPSLRSSNVMSGYLRSVWVLKKDSWRKRSQLCPKGRTDDKTNISVRGWFWVWGPLSDLYSAARTGSSGEPLT